MAGDFKVPFLGRIPMDPALARTCDSGEPFVAFNLQNPAGQAIGSAFEQLLDPRGPIYHETARSSTSQNRNQTDKETKNKMRIAIPITGGKLSSHFGHCEQFAIFDIDDESREIRGREMVTPPPHEPGILPEWLAGLNVRLVIAGGMGQRAQQLFAQNNIEVAVGAPQSEPQELVLQYLAGRLQCGQNICDH